jgi:hypothetical protein
MRRNMSHALFSPFQPDLSRGGKIDKPREYIIPGVVVPRGVPIKFRGHELSERLYVSSNRCYRPSLAES